MELTTWISFMTLMVLLFGSTTAVLAGLVLSGEGAGFCAPFPQSQSDGYTKYDDTSLYPYSGAWSSSAFNQTPAQCMNTCNADGDCKGFFRHNEDGPTVNRGTCRFYTSNTTAATVGAAVDIDDYFTDTSKLVVGVELPGEQTDVYLKAATSRNVFRSKFTTPTTV